MKRRLKTYLLLTSRKNNIIALQKNCTLQSNEYVFYERDSYKKLSKKKYKRSHIEELNSFTLQAKLVFSKSWVIFKMKEKKLHFSDSHQETIMKCILRKKSFSCEFQQKREGGKRTNNYSYALFQFPYLRLMKIRLDFFFNKYIFLLKKNWTTKNVKSQKSI